MSKPEFDLKIDYIELPSTDLDASKAFYAAVFGWTFEDFGPNYQAFNDGRMMGGLNRVETAPPKGGTLVVFFANDLEGTQAKIEAAGGTITVPIFSFPGGRRFQFSDPTGNELAVWAY